MHENECDLVWFQTRIFIHVYKICTVLIPLFSKFLKYFHYLYGSYKLIMISTQVPRCILQMYDAFEASAMLYIFTIDLQTLL